MGLALLDTSIVIAALNRDDALHRAASQAVRAVPAVRGVHLMGLGPTSGIPEVIKAAGLLPRPAPS